MPSGLAHDISRLQYQSSSHNREITSLGVSGCKTTAIAEIALVANYVPSGYKYVKVDIDEELHLPDILYHRTGTKLVVPEQTRLVCLLAMGLRM